MTPAKGKKRTHSQITKKSSQASDQQEEMPEHVPVKRGKVEERSEVTSS